MISAYLFTHYARDNFLYAIHNTSQNALKFVDPKTQNIPLIQINEQKKLSRNYLKKYFSPWDKSHLKQFSKIHTAENTLMNDYIHHPGYGINHLPNSKKWLESIIHNTDMQHFPNAHINVISVMRVNLRNLPTAQPLFGDINKPGEGYPFDYLEATSIAPNTPAMIVQKSHDGAWSFVVTDNTYGWAPTHAFAIVTKQFIHQWKTKNYIALTKNNTPITDASGLVRFRAGIGKIFPRITNHNNQFYSVLFAVANDDQQAVIKETKLRASSATPWPMPLTQHNIATIMNAMIGVKYGWGGISNDSDCTLTTMNLFSTFGIWLPRNSISQITVRHAINLNHLSANEKINKITTRGIPFLTLLHISKPGHIMVYLGKKQGRVYIFQTIWGIDTDHIFGDGGRAILGGTVITPIDLGKRDFNVRQTLLDQINEMTIITKASNHSN